MRSNAIKYFVFLAFICTNLFASSHEITVIHDFGDWKIEHVDQVNSYILRGVGDVSDASGEFIGLRFFRLTCSPSEKDFISLEIPYDHRASTINREYKEEVIDVLFWSDSNEPKIIKMYRVGVVILLNVAIPDKPDKSEDVWKFIYELKAGKNQFSFGFGGKSISFDVKNFTPAFSILMKLCAVQ